MTQGQDSLVERLRARLADRPSTREVAMFGGRAFMVNNRMVASALKDGGLLVRVAAGDHDALAGMPGAAQAEMGTGRSMGPGWISIAAPAVQDDDRLTFWLDAALKYNEATAGA